MRALIAFLLLALAGSIQAASVSGLPDHTHTAPGYGGEIFRIGNSTTGALSFNAGSGFMNDGVCTFGTDCSVAIRVYGEASPGNVLGYIGWDEIGPSVFLESDIPGAPVELLGENNAGTEVGLLIMDPDSGTAATTYGDSFPMKACTIRWSFSGSLSTLASRNCSISDDTGTGNFTLTFDAGLFGGTPTCICMNDSQGFCQGRGIQNSTTWQISMRNMSATLTDSSGQALCYGDH